MIDYLCIIQSSALVAQSVRRITTSAVKNDKIQHAPLDPKFKALQEKFQVIYTTLTLIIVPFLIFAALLRLLMAFSSTSREASRTRCCTEEPSS
jgi:hypothetical protein